MKRLVLLLVMGLLGCGSGSGPGDGGTDSTPQDVTIDPGDLAAQDAPKDLDHRPELPLSDTPGTDGKGAEIPADPGMDDPGPGDLPDDPDVTDPVDADWGQEDPGFEDEDPVGPAPIFDMPMIGSQTTAACNFTGHKTAIKDGVLLDVWKLSYQSWESIGGQLQPIEIRGFAARPVGSEVMPGVVYAHGLGGFAKEANATGTAALLGMFTIAYTGPGGVDPSDPDNLDTQSEGLPAGHDNGYRLFDTVPDPRGSWFWGHYVAAMRAVTCLESRGDVDPQRLGITGHSGGGAASLVAAAVDERIKVSVPLSGTGAWDVATESPAAWQHTLLLEAGLDIQSTQWASLIKNLDARVLLPNTKARIMMVNGSSDEFFPLTAHLATYDAINGTDKRTSIAGNFDHGCYPFMLIEDEKVIAERAALRASGGQRLWFRHWFGTDAKYQYLPAMPEVTAESVGLATMVQATVDTGGTGYDVEKVRFWASNDNAHLFFSTEMDELGGGVYTRLVPAPLQGNTVYYVDVQYKTKGLLFPERFSLSSRPYVPDGLIPDIWTCF